MLAVIFTQTRKKGTVNEELQALCKHDVNNTKLLKSKESTKNEKASGVTKWSAQNHTKNMGQVRGWGVMDQRKDGF